MNDERSEHELWIERAEGDRLNIRNNLQASAVPWETVCFNAQQAAEKYLKAFLVFHRRRPSRTHDLGEILNECLLFDQSLGPLRGDCNKLTDYGVSARYPVSHLQADEHMAREAVAASERVCEAIRAILP